MQKTLHIALCDTNFADRKQMERLLTRESDKRLSSCVFYMETFGSRDALLYTPRVYDAYFLDLADESYSAYDLAKEIQAKGILSPIIFCSSTINYRECGELLPNSVFLDKPIQVEELSLVLDEIILEKYENFIPTVEFRNLTEVFRLTEKEILAFKGQKESHRIQMYLADGTEKIIDNTLDNLRTELLPFPHFVQVNKTTIINALYIEKTDHFHITLTTGETIRFSYAYTTLKQIRTLRSE